MQNLNLTSYNFIGRSKLHGPQKLAVKHIIGNATIQKTNKTIYTNYFQLSAQ